VRMRQMQFGRNKDETYIEKGSGGTAMKKETPEQQLNLLCRLIIRERDNWNYINENSCNDPFWPDGCNMNLTRNHIISYKRDIAELCEENGMPLPEEYFLKIPPEVDDNYMANLKQKARVERLKQQGDRLNQKKQKFVDDGQLEFC